MDLIRLCLTNTYFSYKVRIFEHTQRLAMGSPLSLIIAKIYMEHFEAKALSSFPLTPDGWKRYVDGIFCEMEEWEGKTR